MNSILEIEFKCSHCDCEFTIAHNYLNNKSEIICPSCEGSFSPKATSLLIDGLKNLEDARSENCKLVIKSIN